MALDKDVYGVHSVVQPSLNPRNPKRIELYSELDTPQQVQDYLTALFLVHHVISVNIKFIEGDYD